MENLLKNVTDKITREEKSQVLKYLRSLSAVKCEKLLNYIFVMRDPETMAEISLIMHKALIYKIQRKLDKQIVDLCDLKSIQALREYLDKALVKVYNYLINEENTQL